MEVDGERESSRQVRGRREVADGVSFAVGLNCGKSEGQLGEVLKNCRCRGLGF